MPLTNFDKAALLVESVEVKYGVGEFTRIRLELIAAGNFGSFGLGDLMESLKPGAVLSDFGVAAQKDRDQGTKIKVPGRKLCLD